MELCHTAAENTSCSWFVYESRQSCICFTFVSTCREAVVIVLFSSVPKKRKREREREGKKTFHCEKKLETMCSTNYWL